MTLNLRPVMAKWIAILLLFTLLKIKGPKREPLFLSLKPLDEALYVPKRTSKWTVLKRVLTIFALVWRIFYNLKILLQRTLCIEKVPWMGRFFIMKPYEP